MGLIDAITTIPGLRCLDDCDEWCVGLPLERIRVMDDVETRQLTADVNTQYRRQRAFAITLAFLFAALYLSAICFPNALLFWMTAIDGLLMAIFVLWLLAGRTSWLRRNRALQADIESGVVHCFHHTSCAGPLEALPRSEVVYKANEFSPKKWSRAHITLTAKTPPIALIASEWLQPVEGSAGLFLAGKRELSKSEIDELNRCVNLILLSPKQNVIATAFWLCLVTLLCRMGAVDLTISAVAVTFLSIMRTAPELSRAMALRKDVRSGHVVINRRASKQESTLVPIGNSSEYLPIAKVKWTDGGQPAEWRKFA